MEHTSNQDSIFKIAANLIGACLISGLIIAITYSLTHGIAEEKQIELKQLSLQSLVVEADDYQEIEGKEEWYTAQKDGQVIAYIVPAASKGYGGTIELLVAIDLDLKVIKYSITESNETPGLGDKASAPLFADQFIGKGAEALEVTKDPTQKELIQSISGSTITSRAVTKAVREAVEEVAAFTQGGKS
ncbi:MAG: FMN-binding protein [Peptococcaceae bacterium]|nr:FMN-binding protein [Peptococcaceae bacterium]